MRARQISMALLALVLPSVVLAMTTRPMAAACQVLKARTVPAVDPSGTPDDGRGTGSPSLGAVRASPAPSQTHPSAIGWPVKRLAFEAALGEWTEDDLCRGDAKPGHTAYGGETLPYEWHKGRTPDETSRESPWRMRSSPAPNIILIVVDALRTDHVSAYGYARNTTPNLDALIADQGVVFANAVSASSWTYPSNAAMLTGRTPSSIGVVWADASSSIPQDETMLAEYLHDAGYYTAGFVSAKYAGSEFGFDQGYDVYQERIGPSGNQTDAEEINEIAMDWISDTWTAELSGTQPLFLYLYYFDPHTWYSPPEPYDVLYDDTYTGTLTADVFGDGIIAASGAITPTARDAEHLVALYDGEIAYWDFHLGQMLTYLDGVHLLDNSIVIVTSDHGQMFGEHGKWAHRNSLYEEVLRVPLLVRHSGAISASLVVSTPVQGLDITPSVLDWAGITVPEGLRGMSLRPLLHGETVTATRPVFSEMDVDALSDPEYFAPDYPLRAIRRGDWKHIHHIQAAWRDELYHLHSASVYEVENLIETEPAAADDLLEELIDWFGLPDKRTYLPYACSALQHIPIEAW